MARPPVGRRAWCALALLVVSSAVAAGAAGAAGTGASSLGGGRVPPQAGDTGPPVELVEQTPWVPADGTFAVRVRTNGIDVSRLTLTVHRPVEGRFGFEQSLDGNVGRAVHTLSEEVEPGASAVFRVATRDPASPFDSERLRTGRGVLPIVVTATDADGTETGHLITHLVRLPPADDLSPPLSVAIVAPVHSTPLAQPDRTIGAPDELLAYLEALTAVLDAHPTTPLTIVPTPELVTSLVDLGRPELADALRGEDLAALTAAGPFVDVDPARWLASGLGDELDHLGALGIEALRARPSSLDTSTLLATGSVDAATLGWWAERGTRVVLPEAALTPLDPAEHPFTLTASFRLADAPDLRAVAVDPGLSSHLDGPDPRLGAHHLIADLAMLWFDRPADVRGMVVTPPDGERLDTVLLQELLDALAEPPTIFEPTTVAGLFGRIHDAEAAGPVGAEAGQAGGSDEGAEAVTAGVAPLERDLAEHEPVEDLGPLAFELRTARDLAASYRTLVGDDAPGADAVDGLVVRAGAAQLDDDERTAYLEAATAVVEGDLTGVDLPGEQALTLTDRTGTVPVVVRTEQPDGRHVTLQLDAADITFPEGDHIELTLDAARQELEVPVRLERQGDLRLGLAVVSPDGQLLLAESELTVRSRQLSGVGVILSVGAGLFLLVWWGRHLLSSRGRGTRPPTGDAPATAARDPEEGTGATIDEGDADGAREHDQMGGSQST